MMYKVHESPFFIIHFPCKNFINRGNGAHGDCMNHRENRGFPGEELPT